MNPRESTPPRLIVCKQTHGTSHKQGFAEYQNKWRHILSHFWLYAVVNSELFSHSGHNLRRILSKRLHNGSRITQKNHKRTWVGCSTSGSQVSTILSCLFHFVLWVCQFSRVPDQGQAVKCRRSRSSSLTLRHWQWDWEWDWEQWLDWDLPVAVSPEPVPDTFRWLQAQGRQRLCYCARPRLGLGPSPGLGLAIAYKAI